MIGFKGVQMTTFNIYDRFSHTKNKAHQLKEQKEREVISLYLHAELNQTDISGKTGVSQQEIGRIVQNTQMIDMDNFSLLRHNYGVLPKTKLLDVKPV